MKGLSVFRFRSLNLSDARDYYTILSSWITFFIGVTGLILGFFYYRHKLQVNSNISSIERKRKRLDDLISKIDSFDNLVDNVIHRRFSNTKELKQLRCRISRSFESIEIMLELNHKLLGLDETDVKTILKVNSFVDKNDIIMHCNYTSLNEDILLTVKDAYVDLIQNARRTCYNRVG